jgi:GNAT superfamily N-acetyltransferase
LKIIRKIIISLVYSQTGTNLRNFFFGKIVYKTNTHKSLVGTQITVEYIKLKTGKMYIGPMWHSVGVAEMFCGGLWVHPLFRRLGVASRMVEIAEKEARLKGCTTIFANIREDNQRSLDFFESAGFRVFAQREMTEAIEAAIRQRTRGEETEPGKRQTLVRYQLPGV